MTSRTRYSLPCALFVYPARILPCLVLLRSHESARRERQSASQADVFPIRQPHEVPLIGKFHASLLTFSPKSLSYICWSASSTDTCKKHCELAAITKGENHIEQKELRKTGLECDILWAAVIPRLESGLGLERLQHLRPGISSSLLL
jgi:hypothetical protein